MTSFQSLVAKGSGYYTLLTVFVMFIIFQMFKVLIRSIIFVNNILELISYFLLKIRKYITLSVITFCGILKCIVRLGATLFSTLIQSLMYVFICLI